MQEYLDKIMAIPGVTAVFVLNNRAEVLAKSAKSDMAQTEMEQVGFQVLQLLAAFVSKKFPVQDADFIFQNGRLLFLNFDKLNLFVHCRRNAKISMLRMTINVVMAEAMEDKKVKKVIGKNVIDGRLLIREDRIDPVEKTYIDQILGS